MTLPGSLASLRITICAAAKAFSQSSAKSPTISKNTWGKFSLFIAKSLLSEKNLQHPEKRMELLHKAENLAIKEEANPHSSRAAEQSRELSQKSAMA